MLCKAQNPDNRLLTDKQAVCFNAGNKISGLLPMPRIDDSSTTTVAFLYSTHDAAEKHEKEGGSAFIVGKPFDLDISGKLMRFYVPFMVSNLHVAFQGCPYIRLNKRDGSPHIIDRECTDWVTHPEGDDVAVTCVFNEINKDEHDITHVAVNDFITPEKIEGYDLGIGEDVFMVGRFINLQGRDQIRPVTRFGNISLMIEPLPNKAINKDQESFAVEMRSRTGFSGSPVMVYRTAGTNLARPKTNVENFHALLGINWGFVYDENGENTWLNGVVPAWKIIETLDTPELQEKYDDAVEYATPRILEELSGGGVEPSVANQDDNSSHKEDFIRLLGEAVSSPPTDD
ncbi:MAG: hypothetical protein IH909_06540 [Proteobacteria bacterium]|nr:hypothetical protein [Pseudomonadota bacterium]